MDFEFKVCPRCGTPVNVERAHEDQCGLCLQMPDGTNFDRSTLIAEQDRLTAQISETYELIAMHEGAIQEAATELTGIEKERTKAAAELDYQMRSYISDAASAISDAAATRAAILAKIERLQDYETFYVRMDEAQRNLSDLLDRRVRLESEIDILDTRTEAAEARIRHLEADFGAIIDRFDVPRFDSPRSVRIDRDNFLPVIDGRRFTELSSQGLLVLVNVAYALAHHLTSISLKLGLPQILLIDGLTSNVGHEGVDLGRINAVYDYLMELSDTLGPDLQIIVADNDIPPQAEKYVRLRLTNDDPLVRIADDQ